MTKRRGGARALARLLSYAAFGGVALEATSAAAAPAPDLGTVRYRDAAARREVWLGLDGGGAYLPKRLGLFDRTIWTARTNPAWAVSLTPWLAVGGRHGLAWYGAGDSPASRARLRMHEHQVELSGRPGFGRLPARHRDRLALGVTTHAIKRIDVGGTEFKIGGLEDTVLHLSYGLEHHLAPRWRLGWQAQLRHAWVFIDTQRQVRGAVRATFHPKVRHDLSLEALAYYVNRDEDQAGNPIPRNTVHGQFALEYAWMSRVGVGVAARARFATSYLSGEAPVYEIREEALNTSYGDLTLGLRAVWR